MTRRARAAGVVALLAAIASFLFSLRDLSRVPFHPDESSWIFMSHDFDTALSDFGRLRWRRDGRMTGAIRLRLLDAPMPKYAIGLGRALRGYRNVPSQDWDWFETWEQDVAEGALPEPRLLQTARVTAVLMFALSVGAFFLVAADIGGLMTASLSTLWLVVHPLEGLHMRRAMAESTLQLFSLLFVLVVLSFVKAAKPSTGLKRQSIGAAGVGIALGIAVASKHSAAALAGVGFVGAVAAAWSHSTSYRRWLMSAFVLTSVVAAASVVTFIALNPVLYDQPLRAGYNMLTGRRTLADNQAKYAETVKPEMALGTIASRLRASYREVFWEAPAFSEFVAYDDKIAPDVERYMTRPLVMLANNTFTRLSFLLLAVLGLIGAAYAIVRDRVGSGSRPLQILLAWIATNVVFIALLVPLDWQRYFLPLVPPACVLAGYGMVMVIRRFAKTTEAR